MPCEHYTINSNEVKGYWDHVLKKDTTLYEMNELLDDCLVTFEKFHKQYIIISSLLLDPLLMEEKPFVTVLSPPGFVNPENETRCYLNSTFQHLYYNVLFRDLVFKINCYTILNDLKTVSQHFVHNFQKKKIFREFQNVFVIFSKMKNISVDMVFPRLNISHQNVSVTP